MFAFAYIVDIVALAQKLARARENLQKTKNMRMMVIFRNQVKLANAFVPIKDKLSSEPQEFIDDNTRVAEFVC